MRRIGARLRREAASYSRGFDTLRARPQFAVDEHRGRAEAAALDKFLGVALELLLVFGQRDLSEEFIVVEADRADDRAQDAVLADILISAPISFEHQLRIGGNLPVLERDQG